jgi:hypothetical protein
MIGPLIGMFMLGGGVAIPYGMTPKSRIAVAGCNIEEQLPAQLRSAVRSE